jgi:hypothetical protein
MIVVPFTSTFNRLAQHASPPVVGQKRQLPVAGERQFVAMARIVIVSDSFAMGAFFVGHTTRVPRQRTAGQASGGAQPSQPKTPFGCHCWLAQQCSLRRAPCGLQQEFMHQRFWDLHRAKSLAIEAWFVRDAARSRQVRHCWTSQQWHPKCGLTGQKFSFHLPRQSRQWCAR